MKIVYTKRDDFLGTQRLELVDETLSGKYLVRPAPMEMTAIDGTKYMSGGGSLFLINKAKCVVKEE